MMGNTGYDPTLMISESMKYFRTNPYGRALDRVLDDDQLMTMKVRADESNTTVHDIFHQAIDAGLGLGGTEQC